jgi:HPt (histidine-containing phosphotransfer) domain-containing protein
VLGSGDQPRFAIDVVDNGIGIPADKVEAIFDPFTQAGSSTTRKFGGTGLGLAISRDFPRMMGGDIVATSELGKGSTFHATIAKFTRRLDEKLDEMDSAWQARDFTELAALPHWLKGSGGTVGFDDFTEPAKTLEGLAKASSEDGVDEALATLRGISERLVVPDDSELAASA